MAEKNYYKAVGGITDGWDFHGEGAVFAGSEQIERHFAETGGKQDDRVLYEKASKSDYDAYRATLNADEASGAPVDVVGFAPVGEDALTDSQTDADGKPVKADAQAGKPSDGEPVPTDSPEAARRASGEAEQPSSTDKPAPRKATASE